MSGALIERLLRITITLGEGDLGESGKKTIVLPFVRTFATIQKTGMPSFDKAEVRIYGLLPSTMNAVSTLGIPLPAIRQNNTMKVEAGSIPGGFATVFSGIILSAWQNLDAQPETFLQIISLGGLLEARAPAEPVSYQGSQQVATMMADIAEKTGWNFEDGGVEVVLSNQYLHGTPVQQAQTLARNAGIEMILDSSSHTLAIWPMDKTRKTVVPTISAETGLIGYPKYRDQGMGFTCIFNPSIVMAGQILMQSTIGPLGDIDQPSSGGTQAGAQQSGPNGYWMVIAPLTYNLSCLVPGGPWFCDVSCARSFVPGPTR